MARKCTVCEHPKRKAIEIALADGVANRRIASQHGLSEISVRRHKSEHLARVMAETTIPVASNVRPLPSRVSSRPSQGSEPVQVTEIPHADRLVDRAVGLGKRAESLLDMVEQGQPNEVGDTVVDVKAATGLIREIRGCIELQAKLLGELQTGQAAQVHANPFWVALRTAIVDELADDPVTLMKFAAAVRRIAARRAGVG